MAAPDGPAISDLKRRSVLGGGLTLIGQAASSAILVGSTAILARILEPADFGLLAMVATLTTFAGLFSEAGLSGAIIQRAEVTDAQLNSLFWLNLAIAGAVTALVAALAPLAAWFYQEPRLLAMTLALALPFAIGGACVQHKALLSRQMRFGVLTLAYTVSLFAGALVSIGLALAGVGYWSLVAGRLAQAVSYTGGLWMACPWRPGRPRRGAGVRGLFVFGVDLTGFNLVNYFARNLDNILLGRFAGATALGFYSRAYNLLMFPMLQIRNPLYAVAMPALSRLQGFPEQHTRYYLRLVEHLSFLTMPIVAASFVHSESVIMLFLGDKWLPAAVIFSVLAAAAFIQPVESTKELVMISRGRSRRNLYWGTIEGIAISIAFVIGVSRGPMGIATSYVVVSWLMLLPGLLYAFAGSPISPVQFASAIVRPATASVGTAFCLGWAARAYPAASPVIALAQAVFLGVLVYLAICAALPGGWAFLRSLMRSAALLVGSGGDSRAQEWQSTC